MKKILLFGGFLALTASLASCNKNDEGTTEGKEASLTVSLAGQSRALVTGDNAIQELEDKENLVNNFTAYVFTESSGRLEAKGSPIGNANTVTITGLNTATTKKVVVIANTDIDIAVGGNLNELQNALNFIDLETQHYDKIIAGYGMAMYGEERVQLVEGTNSKLVKIERLAAKVALKEITVDIDTELGYTPADLEDFYVKGVTMQKVVGKAGFLGQNTGVFYGGMIGDDLVSTVLKGYLKDDIEAGKQQFTNKEKKPYGNFFYVLPNAGTTVTGSDIPHYTLLTVIAEYDDREVYFPVVVKYGDEPGVSNNTSYTISLTIKDLQGSEGPEIPKGDATLNVIVEVEDWFVAPLQEESW